MRRSKGLHRRMGGGRVQRGCPRRDTKGHKPLGDRGTAAKSTVNGIELHQGPAQWSLSKPWMRHCTAPHRFACVDPFFSPPRSHGPQPPHVFDFPSRDLSDVVAPPDDLQSLSRADERAITPARVRLCIISDLHTQLSIL